RCLCRRDTQRPGHLPCVKVQQLSGGRRRAEHAGGAGDVPADVVMRRIHRVADAALDLDAEDKRMQKFRAADWRTFGERQDRGRDRAARMDDGLEMSIVEVEYVRADAVDQRGVQYIQPLAPPEHARLRST